MHIAQPLYAYFKLCNIVKSQDDQKGSRSEARKTNRSIQIFVEFFSAFPIAFLSKLLDFLAPKLDIFGPTGL